MMIANRLVELVRLDLMTERTMSVRSSQGVLKAVLGQFTFIDRSE